MAMGIPSIVRSIENIAGVQAKPPAPKKPRAPKKKPATPPHIKQEDTVEGGNAEQQPGVRRSTRIRNPPTRAKTHIKTEEEQEKEEEEFEEALDQFEDDNVCPRCQRVIKKGHRYHLMNCTGHPEPKPSRATYRGYSAMDRELLADLTEEEKKDEKKRLKARMKALSLSNLINYSDEKAEFIVLGSKGDPYMITLNDTKHKCTCLDHRFRRHNCKHICLVLSELGVLDAPEDWKRGVDEKMDELIAKMEKEREEEGELKKRVAAPKRDTNKEAAMKFV